MYDNILESWYFAIWAYNGWSNKNNPGYAGAGNTYQDKVMNYMRQYGYTMNTLETSLFSTGMPAAGQNYPLPGKHSGDLSALDSGKTALVQNVQLNIRKQPAVFFGHNREPVDVLDVLQPGSSVFIIEGPSTNALSRWYRIRPGGGSYTGWAAGEYMYNSQQLLTSHYLTLVDTKVMDPKTTANPTKDWLIQFNQPLNPGTATSQYISIYNYEGEPVSTTVFVGNDGKSVQIIPAQPYKPGVDYYLYISDKVSSSRGITLQKPVLMRFNLGVPGTPFFRH
jgi:hypothetical protein